jgi:hypothetical protein
LKDNPIVYAEADQLRLEWGKNELEEKSTPKWLIFIKLVRSALSNDIEASDRC